MDNNDLLKKLNTLTDAEYTINDGSLDGSGNINDAAGTGSANDDAAIKKANDQALQDLKQKLLDDGKNEDQIETEMDALKATQKAEADEAAADEAAADEAATKEAKEAKDAADPEVIALKEKLTGEGKSEDEIKDAVQLFIADKDAKAAKELADSEAITALETKLKEEGKSEDEIEDAVEALKEEQNKSASDGTEGAAAGGKENDSDEVIVVVREVVADGNGDGNANDEIFINAEGDSPAIGDEVMLGDEVADDDFYEFTGEDETPMYCHVENGKITHIGESLDDLIEDVFKKVVKEGKVIKKKVPTRKKRMSSAQKQALKKAQKKAHKPGAQKARAKSLKIRKRKLGDDAAANENNENNTNNDSTGLDLEKLNNELFAAVVTHLSDKFELSEDSVEFLDNGLPENVLNIELVDNILMVTVPQWIESDDKIEVDDYDPLTLKYELDGEFDNEELLNILVDGENSVIGRLII